MASAAVANAVATVGQVFGLASSSAGLDREQADESVFGSMAEELALIVVGYLIVQVLAGRGLLPKGVLLPRFGGRGPQKGRKAGAARRPPADDGNVGEQGCATTPPRAASLGHFWGMLRGGELGAAAHCLVRVVQAGGGEVPARAVCELCRAAADRGGQEGSAASALLLDAAGTPGLPLPGAALAALLAGALRREDVDLARRIDLAASREGVKMQYGMYEPLLKIFARSGDARAVELFEGMQAAGFQASEGLCGNLLARCSESRNVCLAEQLAAYLRQRSMMTIAIFRTLMKVYACAGMYDRACDLHRELLSIGLEPDRVMCGCLARFASKCGRRDLSEELLRKGGGGEAQNYVWPIQAAGRDGDLRRAEALLAEAEAAREAMGPEAPHPDVSLYNCMLDAYVTNGGLSAARRLFDSMAARGGVNIVTYNTMIKGYCAAGDLSAARQVLQDAGRAGLRPDSASFNCLLGHVVSSGEIHGAWSVLADMERQQVPCDHFTVSIMMKAAKRARNPRDGERALSVLDGAGIQASIVKDDVVFNSVLDVCIHRRDTRRMARALEAFAGSGMKPSVQTYGLMIKANSLLRQPRQCCALWEEMTGRNMRPNAITLSCMLDAFTNARQVERAVDLLARWKAEVPPNIVMYGTLIKGFAAAGSPDRAVDIYRELSAQRVRMSVLAYTSLIDAHARQGKMEQANVFFQQMKDDDCEPNIITFSAMIKGYCVQGDLEEAFSLFATLTGHGLTPDTVLLNTLLDGCVRHSRFRLADSLLEQMAAKGPEPSAYTHSIVVKMWGKRGELGKAFSVVRQAAAPGPGGSHGRVDAQVACCLVSACFLNRAPDKALDLLTDLRSWGVEPDGGVSGAVVTGLVRCGRTRQAVEVAHSFLEHVEGSWSASRGLPEECVRVLLDAMARDGLSESARQVGGVVRGDGLRLALSRAMRVSPRGAASSR